MMTAEDYRKRAQLFAELAALAIKEGDFSKVDEYFASAKLAIDNMRKAKGGQ